MGGDAAKSLQLQPSQDQNSPSGGPRKRRFSNFPIGSVVEVRTNEEDFRGVYFTATVLPPPKSTRKGSKRKSKKLYIEYHNLLAQEGGSDRLREFVGATFVRPEPPLLENVKGFEPDDVVDAFYKDGWWTGIISRAVDGGGRFIVTFQTPPDELEFGLSELRSHWEWVNGSWVRPQKQSISELMFDVGRKVEVSFDRADSQDCWFPATIQEDLRDGTFLVEHNTANTNNNGLTTKVVVDSLHIRPCPPQLKDKTFVLLEKVDAFFDLGWWNGVITKQLENSRYIVFFKQMKLEKEFDQTELRIHMEWKDGKWFTSSKESPNQDDVCQQRIPESLTNVSVANAPEKNSIDATNLSLIFTNADEPFFPDNLKLVHVIKSLPKRRASLSDSVGGLSNPPKKRKEASLAESNKKDRHEGSEKEAIHGSLGPESSPNMEISVAQTAQNQSSSNHQPREEVGEKVEGNQSGGVSDKRKRGRPKRFLVDGPTTPTTENAEEGAVNAGDLTKQVVVIGLKASTPDQVKTKASPKKIANSQSVQRQRKPRMFRRKSANDHEWGNGENRSSGRGRRQFPNGRIPVDVQGLLPVDTMAKCTVTGGNQREILLFEEATELQQKIETKSPALVDRVDKPPTEPQNLPREKNTADVVLDERVTQKETQSEPQIDSSVDNVSIPATEPQSLPCEGIHIVLDLDNENRLENGTQLSIIPIEPENLPFVKNSFLWKTIESMEVFRRMPQKPHFKPLESANESLREGMAIGHMVTFSTVVDRISRLHIRDPISKINDIKGTLTELELHGFDVRVVKATINELHSVKEIEENLMNDEKLLDNQMRERDFERKRIEKDREEIKEQILRLEGELSLTDTVKKKVDEEIAVLQVRLREIKEEKKNAESRFECMASEVIL